MEEDAAFLRNLKSLSGDQSAAWDGFDPSAWRSVPAEDEGAKAARSATEHSSETVLSDDTGYASYDSAELILNFHKLTPEERGLNTHQYKLNKARQYVTEEPANPKVLEKLEKTEWEETGLALGDVSPEGQTFVPWRLVTSYPDMFIGKTNRVRAAPLFSYEALHKNRVWDLYYINCPLETGMRPVVFVPTYQFAHLLAVINAKLGIRLTIPPGKNEERFMLSFGVGNTPRPRFLGRSTSAGSFKNLRDAIPAPHPDDDLAKATPLGDDEFRRLLGLTRADRKSRKRSDRNRLKRIREHKTWGRCIKRVQRYLGLRRKVGAEMPSVAGQLATLDLSQPTSQSPEGSVLFVAIDIEAWERDQSTVTEVGIATLDTTEIQHIPPGDGGRQWFSHIRARHIRIRENSWAVNGRWVANRAEWFGFGKSEFVNQSFVEPLIRGLIDGATFVDPIDGATKPRPVVLVFHEASSDIKYLKLVGYHVGDAKNVLEVVDTCKMHQYLIQSNNQSSLGAVLTYLDIPHRHLHNAGNDAVYTLQAMIGLAVKKRQMSLEKTPRKKAGHVPFAEFKPDDKEGWTSGSDTDGGDPVGLPDVETGWEATRGDGWEVTSGGDWEATSGDGGW
ncbi:uncharacterized protein THITE_2119734 [Thermothielavioides terrestris NRRL 8126]|uniref:Gfd2/YDR514C-like C-terminal domain-containing protein n=1 Tax=Thermothielavioides terrestris (strain ATCC 38088 / NRRL 8126) TaxID=578455 RepID=G2RC66_THETT|nr:uncharacterized protein THITE_2119734 [Thermothielavioides terrestris NRRL 8126]AEO69387.1 hypothetical protein THITE_2119734 [Thermothielavioides terrestris NRRL 8126]